MKLVSKCMLCYTRCLRGHPLSMYAPRGRGGSKKTENMRTLLTDRLREKRTRGGEGVKKAGKSAYVLNGCSLTAAGVGAAESTSTMWAERQIFGELVLCLHCRGGTRRGEADSAPHVFPRTEAPVSQRG